MSSFGFVRDGCKWKQKKENDFKQEEETVMERTEKIPKYIGNKFYTSKMDVRVHGMYKGSKTLDIRPGDRAMTLTARMGFLKKCMWASQ